MKMVAMHVKAGEDPGDEAFWWSITTDEAVAKAVVWYCNDNKHRSSYAEHLERRKVRFDLQTGVRVVNHDRWFIVPEDMLKNELGAVGL